MNLFRQLVIETKSACTRTCKTCLRQTYPGREALAGRFGKAVELPADAIHRVIDQAAGMGFGGPLCLQFFNEPLLDDRLPDIAAYARRVGRFSEVYVNTNGDLLDEETAGRLDGVLDRLNVALYGGGNREAREGRILALFERTRITFTGGVHVVTHYSHFGNLDACIAGFLDRPCVREAQQRMIISHTGEMLMCCEDIGGEWSLGNVGDATLEELWFDGRHADVVERLSRSGGRRSFPYCSICPRP